MIMIETVNALCYPKQPLRDQCPQKMYSLSIFCGQLKLHCYSLIASSLMPYFFSYAQNPPSKIAHVPSSWCQWAFEGLLEILNDMPYVWRMLKDIVALNLCWRYRAEYVIIEMLRVPDLGRSCVLSFPRSLKSVCCCSMSQVPH